MLKTEAYINSSLFLALSKKNGYKAGVLYAYKGDGFIWDRNSTAYRTDSAGLLESMAIDVPRVDYSNTCPEIIIEKESTNLLHYSQEFDNAYWTKTQCTITANATTAPDGTTTADKIVESVTASIEHSVSKSGITISSGVDYTESIYAKPAGRDWLVIQLDGAFSGSPYAYFNVASGTIGTQVGTPFAEIEPAANGFYRIKITRPSTSTSANVYIYLANANNGVNYTGDGTSGVYIWGAQLEQSTEKTSYIPTTTTSATRPADISSNTTVDFTQDEATIFVRARLDFLESIRGLVTIFDGTTFDDYISLWYVESGGDKFLAIDTYTNPDQNTIYTTLPDNGIYNIALGYNLNTGAYSLAVNGVIEQTGTFVNSVPTSTPLVEMTLGRIGTEIGSRIIGTMFFNTKLDDASLVNRTT